jgi:hypothetical protein
VQVLFILTCKTLRTMLNVFLVLFRSIEIALKVVRLATTTIDNSHVLAVDGWGESVPQKYVTRIASSIKTYHVEASLDLFNVQQQMFFLAPGQRLVYRHNFSGMFNDISQVIYFHYPDYIRSAQVSLDQMPEHGMNSLSCLMNIIPQLRVMYDDEPWLPFGLVDSSEWMWIVSNRQIYLWDGRSRRLLGSSGSSSLMLIFGFFGSALVFAETVHVCYVAGPGILDLAAYYLLCNCGVEYFDSLNAEGGGQQDGNDSVKMTDFSHARLVKRPRAQVES